MRLDDIVLDGRHLEAAWWGPPPDQAPTLVLLHEGLGCVALWRDFPERLQAATGCGVFAWSRFGYGRSDPARLPWPMTYMHDEALNILPRVLNKVGVQRAISIGHSDGASIAAIHAGGTRDPHLMGIVLMAAHFFVEDLNLINIANTRIAYETTDLRGRLARYHRDVDNTFNGWSGAWLDPRFRSFDITASLQAIQVPVLGLQGADDPYGSLEQLRVLECNTHVATQTLVIPGARHSPHLEARDETFSAILDFVNKRLMENAE